MGGKMPRGKRRGKKEGKPWRLTVTGTSPYTLPLRPLLCTSHDLRGAQRAHRTLPQGLACLSNESARKEALKDLLRDLYAGDDDASPCSTR